MTPRGWAVVAAASTPVLVGAILVSATLGPIGALIYTGLLLAGINTPRLFRKARR